MTAATSNPRQAPVASWVAQMIGTLVLALAVYGFVHGAGTPFPNVDPDWKRYAAGAALLGIIPAMLYLRIFKDALNADEAAVAAPAA